MSDTPHTLMADLSLVLPAHRAAQPVAMSAKVQGRSASIEQAIAHAKQWLSRAKAPAIIGPECVSVEAVRAAVALAERMCARLLTWRTPEVVGGVRMEATLGEAAAADLLIWVGCDASAGPVAHWLGERAAQNARATTPDDAAAHDAMARAMRPVAVLGPNIDAHTAAQWHAHAASVQEKQRMKVVQLPALDAANWRGALEVVAWQTGLSLEAGGVDFADGAPRTCGSLESLLQSASIDAAIVIGAVGDVALPQTLPHVAIGPDSPNAEVSFTCDLLGAGIASRVMRFDGVVLWQCDDPANARADDAAALLTALLPDGGFAHG